MTNTTKMSSPLKCHGGKSYLADKLIRLMPPHTRYVETHFGGGAVLFAKDPEGVSEYANDINGELTNFWRVLREDHSLLQKWLEATPLSRVEFEKSLSPSRGRMDGIDYYHAYCLFIRNRQSRQGLGKSFCTPTSRIRRGMNENVSAWLSAVDGLPEVHARLRRVEVRNQDALSLIRELDSPDTLFFCDPPYLQETRVSKEAYGEYEMTPEQHETLLHFLHRIEGKFLLCGYMCPLYDNFAAVAGWWRVDFDIDNKASSASTKPKKIESVWANYEIQADQVRGGRLYPPN